LPSLEDATNEIDLPHLLQQSDTKHILLEFWISHCGHSIDAVQTLNAISHRYKRSLKIVAVNPDDSASPMKLFQKNFSPGFLFFSTEAGSPSSTV
jgi:thioredoxin-like negative regulator of GroEL